MSPAAVRAICLSAEIEPSEMGLSSQSRGVRFLNLLQLITANKRKHTHTHRLYSSSCTSKSNLLHRDNRKSEATVCSPSSSSLLYNIRLCSPAYLPPSLSLTALAPVLRDSISPPASKLRYNYTSCFIELDRDNSLYVNRDGPPLKTHPGNPITSSQPGDRLHLPICSSVVSFLPVVPLVPHFSVGRSTRLAHC